MANWCNNMIEVTGRAKDLRRFDGQFKKEHKRWSGGIFHTSKEDFKVEDDWIDYNTRGEKTDGLIQVCYIYNVEDAKEYSEKGRI